jgi:N utilization substance protein B
VAKPSGEEANPVLRNRAKHQARARALQALYQWELSEEQASEVFRQFLERQEMDRVDVEYFERLFKGVSHDVDSLDKALIDALDRPIDDLDPIERNVLRIATFEMQQCPEVPVRVLINEGIEITKRFGADQGHKYVNGVLDKLALQLRIAEMQAK